MGMGGNLYRRNDVSRSCFWKRSLNLKFKRIFQLGARIRRLALNWSLVAAAALATPATAQNNFQDSKAAPLEFSAEEFISEWGGFGFYKAIDLPGANRKEVEPFRRRWLSSWGAAELRTILDKGSQYRHYVKKRLREEGLPACIEYIPVIESSYKPLAAPASGKSVGLWQFMENSIERYLRKTKWVDERRDPWKSTDAAIKKLSANYKQFGDWLLAIAAYNCGAGAVQRALKKTSEKTFWSLSKNKLIPDHAIAYVPNLLAVSDIAENAFWYGIDLPEAFDQPERYSPLDDFDYVKTEESVSLRALAVEMRMDAKILLDLNPALLHEATPPDEAWEIRLPSGMGPAAKEALWALKARLMSGEDFADNY